MARLLSDALQGPLSRDHDLVAAVRGGEDSAFEELFSRYRGPIRAYASTILVDRDRAEDVTQEVFISALCRLRNTERPVAFRPWIYQIARNACIDELRRSRHKLEVPLDEAQERPGGTGELPAREPGPELVMERKQQLDALRGAFRGLPALHLRILVLRELEGLSYHDIGARLGISRPVVESTLFRARRRLADEYEELTSGRRCVRARELIDAWEGRTIRRLGIRERRQLARHLVHCHSCRRHAALAQAGGVPPYVAPVVAGSLAAA